MDQLCIDQDNIDEKNQEVSKMGQYYTNAEATLVNINIENKLSFENKRNFAAGVLKTIINSNWFTRS
jgi:hypothetical protein